MVQALYRKWRPHRWEDVFGQEHVVTTLRNAIAAGRFVHAYLLVGPRGTGKTTTARLMAKAVNCLDPDLTKRPCDQCEPCQAVNQSRFLDLIEIDAASNTSVEDVRDLRDKINFSPNQGRYKVYIVDEVHMLSTAAFNALLKTLEEPPRHAIFILVTTEVHKIPATVLSRCQRHEFRRIPVADIVARLTRIVEEEGIQAEPAALTLLARQATGAMRDAISLLDQLASTGKPVTLEWVQSVLGTATSQTVLDLIEALLKRDPAAGLDVIQGALDSGSDPRQLARQAVEYLRNLLMVRLGNADQVEATPEMSAQMAAHAQVLPVPELLRVIHAFNQAATEGRGGWLPALPLEMAFVEAMQPAELPASPTTQPEAPAPRQAKVLHQSAIVKDAPAQPAESSARPDAGRQPQPPPEEEGGEEEPASATDAQTSRRLEDSWKQILALTRQQNPNTYGLLNSSKTRHLKEGVLTLGFASDVLKFQMEKNANLELVQGVLQQVFNEPITLRCVTLSGKRTAPPPGVDSDGMVASALRDLGGEIVDVQ